MYGIHSLESRAVDIDQTEPPPAWRPVGHQPERRSSWVLGKLRQRIEPSGLHEPAGRKVTQALLGSHPLVAHIPQPLCRLPDWLDYAAQLSPSALYGRTTLGWRPQIFLPLRATVFNWLAQDSGRSFAKVPLPTNFELPHLTTFLNQEADVARHCAMRCEAVAGLDTAGLLPDDWVRNLQMLAMENLETVLNLRLQGEEVSLPLVWVGCALPTHQVYLGVRRIVLADTDVISLRLDDYSMFLLAGQQTIETLYMPTHLLEQPQAQSLWAAVLVPLHRTPSAFFERFSALSTWHQQQTLAAKTFQNGTLPRLVGTLLPVSANWRTTCVVDNFDLGVRSRLALRLAQVLQAPLTVTPITRALLLHLEEEAARLCAAIRAAELQAVLTVLHEVAPGAADPPKPTGDPPPRR
jgi:hypothetical protein